MNLKGARDSSVKWAWRAGWVAGSSEDLSSVEVQQQPGP